MFRSSNIRMVLALVAAGVVATQWSERASAQVIDCNTAPAGALQAAIDAGQRVVEFTGTCNEFVTANQTGTTIRGVSGNPALDVIAGGMRVRGAQHILIENLTVSGDSFGIVDGAFATVRNSIIENTNYGFFIVRNSGARLEGNTFGPALDDDWRVSCTPICVIDNSYARMENNTVNGESNDPYAGAAVGLFLSSSVLLNGGNTITNSGTGWAVSANLSSDILQVAGGNGTDQINGDVDVFLNSVLDTRQAVITGDITVGLNSSMRVGNLLYGGNSSLIQINGNIALSEDSALAVESPLVTINGDVTCADIESSASGTFAGTGENLCSGFSSVHSDFNCDGKADVLWRNSTGATAIWLMDGTTLLAGRTIGKPPLEWVISKIEDYDGDCKADILWRHTVTGDTAIWLMDGFTLRRGRTIARVDPDWVVQ